MDSFRLLKTKSCTVLPSPGKGNDDTNEYKVIRLENGLTACLISQLPDKNSNKEDNSDSIAEVALSVDVGSYSDPKEAPGLAHLLEHLLLMQSEKYPMELDFEVYLKQHGGYWNGATSFNCTTFEFNCFRHALYHGLDKFAQCFISPVFTKGIMKREIEAVDCEFKRSGEQHWCRINQLLSSFYKESSLINLFSCGNSITLQENIKDDDLYKLLHNFRQRHYSAHRMTLVVQASLLLEVLESYVVNCFSDVPNNGLPGFDFKLHKENFFDTTGYNKAIFMQSSINETNDVYLTWRIPAGLQKDYYKYKAIPFLGNILMSCEDGSLSKYLMTKSLIKKHIVYCMYDRNLYMQYSLILKLTDKGSRQFPKIIEIIFGYINLLKTMKPEELREIYKTQQSNQWNLAEKVGIKDLSRNMHIYAPEDYLRGGTLYFKYDESEIFRTLNHLVPEKMNVLVCSFIIPETIVYDKEEFWYKTKYAEKNFSSEWMQKWKSAKPKSKWRKPILPLIKDIYYHSSYSMDKFTKVPMNSSKIQLYYKNGKTPLVKYEVFVELPVALSNGSLRSACMLDMFIRLLQRKLNYAKVVKTLVGFSISCTYSDDFIRKWILPFAQNLLQMSSTMTEAQFNMIKDLQMEYYQIKMSQSSKMCNDLSSSVLLVKYYALWEKHSALRDITFKDMKQYIEVVLKEYFMTWQIEGNADIQALQETLTKLVDILNYKMLNKRVKAKAHQIELPIGQRCCRVLAYNKLSQISTITNYYQLGLRTTRSIVIMEIINFVIHISCMKILRTQEQLGYYINSQICHNTSKHKLLGFELTVETRTEKFSPEYIDARIEAFLENQFEIFKFNGVEGFLEVKRSLKCTFKENSNKIGTLKELLYDEVVVWWHNHLTPQGSQYKKMSFQVIGHKNN